MRFLASLLLALIVAAPVTAAIPAGGQCEWLNDYIGRTFALRPSVNASPYVYVPVGEQLATLELTGPMFPLIAPESITVRNVALDAKAGIATLFFRSAHGEKGELRFIAPRASGETMGQPHVDALLALVSEDSGVAPYVLNAETGVVHYVGSNHSRGFETGSLFSAPAQAVAEGHRLCPSCFAPIHLLPGYEEEVMLGRLVASEVRSASPISTDPDLQVRVKAMGEKVLANWSLPLRGYHYRFSVVEAAQPNAVACPGGWIFVADTLVDLCETDYELEAILAHEISHVEMRHGLRQLRSAQKAARVGAIAGAIGAGLLASQGESGAARAAGALGMLVVAVASEVALAGYSREMEAESDAAAVHYIVRSSGLAQRAHLARVLAKLEYFEQCETGRLEEYDSFWRHPPTAVRSDFALNADTRFFPEPLTFTLPMRDGGTIALKIGGMFHHAYYEPQQMTKYEDMTGYEFGFGGPGSKTEVSDRTRSDTRIFAVVTADESVPRGTEFKDVEVMIDGVWWRFDNREDTALYPGASTSVALVHRQRGMVVVTELTPTQLRYLGKVKEASGGETSGPR
jgi:Zn-dependent protease with chaperone function